MENYTVTSNRRPIVFVSSVTHYGGAETCSIDLLKEIKKQHKVVVLDFYGSSDEYIQQLKENGIEYHIVIPHAKRQIIGGKSTRSRLWNMLKAGGEIKQLIRLLRMKLKEVEPKIIWVISEKTMFCVGRAVGRLYPTIRIVHGQHGASPRWYCLRDWKNIGMIVGVNYESIEIFRSFPWACGKMAVVYNGIDFDVVQITGPLLSPLPCRDARVKIIMPATLIPLKAHSIAIEGFAKFCQTEPNAVLWICGDTPNNLPCDYENSLHDLCRQLGLEKKIYFLGWRSDILAIMNCADIMILTSETEGLPRSILEAMALGSPVIATAVGGIPEIIRDGIDGLLIRPGNSDLVAKSLIKLKDPDLRRQMATNAKERVKSEFALKKQAVIFLGCVENIVKNHTKRS